MACYTEKTFATKMDVIGVVAAISSVVKNKFSRMDLTKGIMEIDPAGNVALVPFTTLSKRQSGTAVAQRGGASAHNGEGLHQ